MPAEEKTAPDIPEALAAERAYLAAARAELARMRARTLSLDAEKAGGGAVATEYLKGALYHRARALLDDPATPLFFGRLDMEHDADETYYVGRRHVHDDDGDPVVVDWRADVSRAFYRATRTEPMGVALRRRFGFEGGQITAYEDEHLVDPQETDAPKSHILASEIERPRVGPMRDIVATIQPEQDVIVRADVNDTVCVQGAPGTGKTAVGLHRAAYLLYAFRDRLRRGGVLVVGPNAAFISYIAAVLPALGEVDVTQVTVDELVSRVPVRGTDTAAVATVKGDARMATVLRNAVYARLRRPEQPLVLAQGSRRWRVPTHELTELVDELSSRDVRYGAGRTMLAQRLAHAVLTKMEAAGESPDDRVQDSVARSAPVKAMVAELWPAVEPARVVMTVLSDPDELARAADGVLSDDEQRLLLWPTSPRGPRSARWSMADAVLVDEAADLIEREPSLGHVVLDEAQDLSPMQLRAVGRRCSTAAATVLGDLAQGTTPWASTDWAATLRHLGKPDATVEVLERGYRVPATVIDFASRLLPHIAPGVGSARSVRENPGRLDLVPTADVPASVVTAVRTALEEPGSVGVIVADADVAPLAKTLRSAGLEHDLLGNDEAAHRVALVPAALAKGLEFDAVVVVEPAAIVAGEPSSWQGLRRLYVVLTRAVSGLTVVHAQPLPAELDQTVVA
ncbi:MAG: HelD family protein [Actinomycetes bacterium]